MLVNVFGEYVCECGKTFTNSQAFNGHKSHCHTHQTIKHGSLENLKECDIRRIASIKRVNNDKRINREKELEDKNINALEVWISEQHRCETCGKIMTEKFGSGRFCCRSCANTRTHTDESKAKISKSINLNNSKRFSICSTCGDKFYTRDFSRHECYKCLPVTRRTAKCKPAKNLYDVSARTLSKILKRMELPCSCCGIYIEGIVWDIHHIKPVKFGGTNDITNLTYVCPNCHRIAHTDLNKLSNNLISLDIQLNECGKNWIDYYFVSD